MDVVALSRVSSQLLKGVRAASHTRTTDGCCCIEQDVRKVIEGVRRYHCGPLWYHNIWLLNQFDWSVRDFCWQLLIGQLCECVLLLSILLSIPRQGPIL